MAHTLRNRDNSEVTAAFVLVQLSDPHIGATWGERDSAAHWRVAIEEVRRLRDPPGAVLVSGDLTDSGTDGEYAVIESALATVGAPAYVLPGNHDDRARLRHRFALPGEADAPVRYAVDIGPMRLVALDTTKPGEDAGALGDDQLEWLDHVLAAAPDRVTLIAMHHPPFATGMPLFDAIGLGAGDLAAFADVVERHPQVRRIVAGHVHRAITAEVAGRVAMTAPSTYAQARLDFTATTLTLSDEPPGFIVHRLDPGGLTSHIQPV